MNDPNLPPEDEDPGYEIVDEPEQPKTPKKASARPPLRKKRRRRRRVEGIETEIHDASGGSWILQALLAVAGFMMCLTASVGLFGKEHAFRAIGGMLLYLLVLMPLAIGTLMTLGMVAGIDYGEFKRAVLNLAAIAFLNNGLIWMLALTRLPLYADAVFCGLVCFGLFMLLFELDFWETNISIAAINAVEFGAWLIFVLAIKTS